MLLVPSAGFNPARVFDMTCPTATMSAMESEPSALAE
jgi:hypothetical protein